MAEENRLKDIITIIVALTIGLISLSTILMQTF